MTALPVETAPTSARPLRVLVVDDDDLQLRALQRVARDFKHIELHSADNGIDALLAVGTVMPDLVVIDVFMPGLDGLEACRRIKANPRTRHLEVVLASAGMTEELERTARAVGAKAAISKPIDLEKLVMPPITVIETPAQVAKEPTVRGANLLVDMLREAGVEVVFGLPGGAISPVHDALLDSGLRVVTTRHESGAMFAAAAYARATGKLGVVAVTSGPGVLNSMTGLATAWCDGVPVMLLVGEVPRSAHGKGVLQDGSSHGLQIVEMARHVAKLAVEVPRPSALPHLIRRAIATALSGRRGPVVMTLPMDVTTAQISRPRTGGSVTMGGMVASETIDELIEVLRGAQRPLLLAGSGVRADNAPERLLRVAERLRCPVATTPKGKGVFPEDHPLALGVLGMGGHPSARNYLENVDVVVAIGTSLGDLATDGFSPRIQASRALVHVDIDARQIGKSYAPTHAIVASAAELLGGLAERLQSTPAPAKDSLRVVPGGVVRIPIPSSTRPGRIAPHDALAELQSLVPDDAIFTVDSGDHFLFAVHYLRVTKPDQFLVMTGLGSMGQSIGAAVGAQLACPDRFVTAICGDGCFAMNAFEIATAVAERLPIRVLVFNDERLGMVENGHLTVYGRRPEYPTTPLDVCAVAAGLGATTFRVDGLGQPRSSSRILRATKGPVVVYVRIDPQIVLPRQDRVATMTPGAVAAPGPQPRLAN